MSNRDTESVVSIRRQNQRLQKQRICAAWLKDQDLTIEAIASRFGVSISFAGRALLEFRRAYDRA